MRIKIEMNFETSVVYKNRKKKKAVLKNRSLYTDIQAYS